MDRPRFTETPPLPPFPPPPEDPRLQALSAPPAATERPTTPSPRRNERRDAVNSTAVVISDLSILCTPGICSVRVAAGACQSVGPVVAVGRRCSGRHTAGSFVYCHLTCQGACSQRSKVALWRRQVPLWGGNAENPWMSVRCSMRLHEPRGMSWTLLLSECESERADRRAG